MDILAFWPNISTDYIPVTARLSTYLATIYVSLEKHTLFGCGISPRSHDRSPHSHSTVISLGRICYSNSSSLSRLCLWSGIAAWRSMYLIWFGLEPSHSFTIHGYTKRISLYPSSVLLCYCFVFLLRLSQR